MAGECVCLLQVVDQFQKLTPLCQSIIKDVTDKMGNGMADFVGREVVTIEDYNKVRTRRCAHGHSTATMSPGLWALA